MREVREGIYIGDLGDVVVVKVLEVFLVFYVLFFVGLFFSFLDLKMLVYI